MPFGTIIETPKKSLTFCCSNIIAILGVGVTYAKPAIGALKAFGASVNPQEAHIYMKF